MFLAYKRAVEDAYQGNGDPAAQHAAHVAFDQAWARELRPVAERATDADLKAALNA